MKKYFVYIIELADGSFYTGMTSNVDQRLQQHNGGFLGSAYVKRKLPIRRVYSEFVGQIMEARKREKQVKRFSRLQKQKLIESSPVYPGK